MRSDPLKKIYINIKDIANQVSLSRSVSIFLLSFSMRYKSSVVFLEALHLLFVLSVNQVVTNHGKYRRANTNSPRSNASPIIRNIAVR